MATEGDVRLAVYKPEIQGIDDETCDSLNSPLHFADKLM
jgi:hypothetical protein